MFYRLRDEYILRGWQHLNGALIKRPLNVVKAINNEEYNLLMLCDGCTDLEGMLEKEEEKILQSFVDKKIIEIFEEEMPLLEDQKYVYYDNRYVNTACWSITGKCNFRCRHCYMDAPGAMLGELSTEEALNIIDQMHACGIFNVDLTGGEPFVRKDFWTLVDKLCEYKIQIRQIYTNGWLLNDKVLDEFEKRDLHPDFSISFDGIGWHDWMRGIDGAEKAAIRAFELCQKRKYSVNVEMCLHKGNAHTIRETIRLLPRYGIHTIKIGKISDTELWLKNGEGNSLSQEEYYQCAINYIPQYFEDGMPMSVIFGGVIFLHYHSTRYEIVAMRYAGDSSCLNKYLCGAVRSSSYITPEGRLLPCISLTSWDNQTDFPRIQEIGLQSLLKDSMYMRIADARVQDLLKVNTKCNACEYKYLCGGGCRASAALSSNDLMGSDLEQCFFLKNNYHIKLKELTDRVIQESGK